MTHPFRAFAHLQEVLLRLDGALNTLLCLYYNTTLRPPLRYVLYVSCNLRSFASTYFLAAIGIMSVSMGKSLLHFFRGEGKLGYLKRYLSMDVLVGITPLIV